MYEFVIQILIMSSPTFDLWRHFYLGEYIEKNLGGGVGGQMQLLQK
jgi:hypothetical protein